MSLIRAAACGGSFRGKQNTGDAKKGLFQASRGKIFDENLNFGVLG
jgi:hypothetical protein